MHVQQVGFLASGWALASADAHGTSIALSDGDEVVLVDGGGSPARGLAEHFPSARLERVYLTHEHPDHCWGLLGLVHSLRFAGERGSLTIHGPAGALSRVRSALEALGIEVPFELVWTELSERGQDGPISWAPGDHSVPVLCYRFDDVVVCGDTRPSEAVIELSRGASLLVHEASHPDEELTHRSGHSAPADAGRVAHEAAVDALALIHIHPSVQRDEARKGCGFEPAFTPVDGDRLTRTGAGWKQVR